jgi:hypothetical protein
MRGLLTWRAAYHTINREERNVAALLYHILLVNGNLQRFLTTIDCRLPVVADELAIYVEYALLRDLWRQIGLTEAIEEEANQRRRDLIRQLLPLSNADILRATSEADFNRYFIAEHKVSRDTIQSPGAWNLLRLSQSIADDQEFYQACMIKWAFKAKPDIVIHTSHDAAVCIEAKYESGEGRYPVGKAEVAEFRRRQGKGASVSQTEVQRYLMQDVLGLETQHIMIRKRPKPDAAQATYTWAHVFRDLVLDGVPDFAREWIARLIGEADSWI